MNANSAPRMRLRSAIFEAACWIAILAVYGWYLLNRGTWNDEFWTIWLGDPSVRLGEAVNDRWLRA